MKRAVVGVAMIAWQISLPAVHAEETERRFVCERGIIKSYGMTSLQNYPQLYISVDRSGFKSDDLRQQDDASFYLVDEGGRSYVRIVSDVGWEFDRMQQAIHAAFLARTAIRLEGTGTDCIDVNPKSVRFDACTDAAMCNY